MIIDHNICGVEDQREKKLRELNTHINQQQNKTKQRFKQENEENLLGEKRQTLKSLKWLVDFSIFLPPPLIMFKINDFLYYSLRRWNYSVSILSKAATRSNSLSNLLAGDRFRGR